MDTNYRFKSELFYWLMCKNSETFTEQKGLANQNKVFQKTCYNS